ncbi:MAG TPA: hypothetical protein PLU53_00110 [Bacteroidia bacterium]|nr:hypothetical protein [Bacteroidia bacterium]
MLKLHRINEILRSVKDRSVWWFGGKMYLWEERGGMELSLVLCHRLYYTTAKNDGK